MEVVILLHMKVMNNGKGIFSLEVQEEEGDVVVAEEMIKLEMNNYEVLVEAHHSITHGALLPNNILLKILILHPYGNQVIPMLQIFNPHIDPQNDN